MNRQANWEIHFIANGVACQKCGKVEEPFLEHTCNAHTHGMDKYGHMDFQVVLHLRPKNIVYVLNSMCERVCAGEKFRHGDLVSGIFQDCDVRVEEFREANRTVLRVIIPDGKNIFPENENCRYPYFLQKLPLKQLECFGGGY